MATFFRDLPVKVYLVFTSFLMPLYFLEKLLYQPLQKPNPKSPVATGRYMRLGCDVTLILKHMNDDQREHRFAAFGETYLKVRLSLVSSMDRTMLHEFFTERL